MENEVMYGAGSITLFIKTDNEDEGKEFLKSIFPKVEEEVLKLDLSLASLTAGYPIAIEEIHVKIQGKDVRVQIALNNKLDPKVREELKKIIEQ
ncbi:hypothetical protein ACFLZN_02175 [Nanoarchaeota archaeon]